MEGIFGRIGDAVKIRGLFVAPSQLMKLQKKYPDIRFQIHISRESHSDYLIVRYTDSCNANIEEEFQRDFKETCTVRIDRMERQSPETLKEGDSLILDQRDWR
jgi:phenylacetate-CoA ligase